VEPDDVLEHPSLVELSVRRLRHEILSGALAPGERLIEEQLTQRFGISRAPLREALRSLGQQGLVEHLPRRGVRVTELSREDVDELFGLHDALGATGLGTALTAPLYRLYALNGGEVARPGLVRVATGGVSVEVELYGLSPSALGTLLTRIAPPLGLGTIQLDGGHTAHGFLCEAYAADEAADISRHGSWPDYLLSQTTAPEPA
jgi:hypothetical protein